jgi:Ankyrin repeats (3 copies)
MLTPVYCTNCGNKVTIAGATTCPYCEKTLPVSATAGKSLRSCIITIFVLIMGAGLAVALYFAFPDFWSNLLAPQTKKEEPKPAKVQRTAETDKAALNSLYNRYLQVLENPEPEKFREFVQNGRLSELSDGGSKSLIYDQLVPDISMNGMGVDRVIVEGDRGIVVTRAQSAGQITDNQGNPVGTIGIAKCIYEDDGWKIFSQSWHINSPTDPVEDSMSWLTPKTNNAAAAELLSHGVEFSDETCLDAISRKRSEVVNLCLKAGFGPNTPWMRQATAFDSAVSKIANGDDRDLETIKLMLAAGANVDSKTGGALTPLMQASIYCKPKFAEVFINAGADVNFKNDQGLTPLVLAQNCPEVKELLEKQGAK